jgi:hypothetical protein
MQIENKTLIGVALKRLSMPWWGRQFCLRGRMLSGGVPLGPLKAPARDRTETVFHVSRWPTGSAMAGSSASISG